MLVWLIWIYLSSFSSSLLLLKLALEWIQEGIDVIECFYLVDDFPNHRHRLHQMEELVVVLVVFDVSFSFSSHF